MKGLLLAGGSGTRLWPCTAVVNKHLLPCYDRPVIYYPLSTLISLGVDDLCIVCRTRDLAAFHKLLHRLLQQLDIKLKFCFQDEPAGLADAVLRAERWIDRQPFWMILGDNLFTAAPNPPGPDVHCLCFSKEMTDPRAFGVVETWPQDRIVRIEEKPAELFSNKALTGLYRFDRTAVERAKTLQPSARHELEITDLIRSYITDCLAYAESMPGLWFDTGTPDTLLMAANYVAEATRLGLVTGSPELAAYNSGRIDWHQINRLIAAMPACTYKESIFRQFNGRIS